MLSHILLQVFNLKLYRVSLFLIVLLLFARTNCQSQNWNQIFRGQIPKIDNYNYLSRSAAISGNTAIIGCTGDDYDINGANKKNDAGAVYIYSKDSTGTWVKEAKLIASDRKANMMFGLKVAIDGNIAVVGTYYESEDTGTGGISMKAAGAAYVFEKGTSGWVQVTKLVAFDRDTMDQFGSAVAISGSTIAIGSPSNGTDTLGLNEMNNTGAIYIYERDNSGHWNFIKKMIAPDRSNNDYMGENIAMKGNLIVAGSQFDGDDTTNNHVIADAGSAYVFEKDSTFGWVYKQKILPIDRTASASFSYAIAVEKDEIIISSYNGTDSTNNNFIVAAGSIYSFRKNSSSNWIQTQKICAPQRQTYDIFGASIAIDNGQLIVGMSGDDEDTAGGNIKTDAGCAYMYKKDLSGAWYAYKKITILSDRDYNDHAGETVAISNNSAILGAPQKAEYIGPNAFVKTGVFYIFETCSTINIKTYQTACKKYISPSKKYTWSSNGTYYDTLLSIGGCDSILEIHLQLLQNSSNINLNICRSYQSPSGKYIWKTSGVYYDTIVNVNGCDSIIEANVNLISSKSTISDTACKTYVSPSGKHIWRQSGIYTDTILNWKNCDSIITIDLYIKSTQSTINANACYIYNSPSGKFSWKQSGIYTDTLVNYIGCDSIITINLAILKSSSINNLSFCKTYISPSGKYSYNINGTYYDTIINSKGCDSIITLNLTKTIIDKSVVQNNETLISNATGNVTYQWINCLNANKPVAGATSKSFTPNVTSKYAVIVTKSGCSDTSTCFSVIIGGIEKINPINDILIYPNPNNGVFQIEGSSVQIEGIKVYTIEGKFFNSYSPKNNTISIEISEKGSYILECIDKIGNTYYKKVLVF